MKKMLVVVLAMVFCFSLITISSAAEKKAMPAKAMPKGPMAPRAQGMPMMRPGMPSILSGSVTKIDTTDPAKQILEIKSDTDNTTHTIEVTAWTGVSKLTDLSELKTGDAVRVMTRTAEGKEVAINVLFGKLKAMPVPRPAMQGPRPGAQQVPGQAKKK